MAESIHIHLDLVLPCKGMNRNKTNSPNKLEGPMIW